MKIYGNEILVTTIEGMLSRNRLANTVLFYGEKGSGRKTLAQYYCRLLLCRNPQNGKPCGECKPCHNIDMGIHPDIHTAEKSGKLGGISVDTAKFICSDAYLTPNNGERKIYLFEDCHNMDPRTQNTLLKIIEEPPSHAYFIFTAISKDNFLPTVISRCLSFAVSTCTEDECRTALTERGYTWEQINDATANFHGNIGMCIEYLEGETLKKITELTKTLISSIINKDEYMLAATLHRSGKDRDEVKLLLTFFDNQIRDMMMKSAEIPSDILGFGNDATESITFSQAEKIHKAIAAAWKAIETNVNHALVMTSLCADLADIIL